MRLIYNDSQTEVRVGDPVHLRDGDKHTITRIVEPHKPSSTGRVEVDGGREFFPGVIDAHWVEREDWVSIQLFKEAKLCINKARASLGKDLIDNSLIDLLADNFPSVDLDTIKTVIKMIEREESR